MWYAIIHSQEYLISLASKTVPLELLFKHILLGKKKYFSKNEGARYWYETLKWATRQPETHIRHQEDSGYFPPAARVLLLTLGWQKYSAELNRCMGLFIRHCSTQEAIQQQSACRLAETHDTTGWHCGAQCAPRLLRYAEGQWSVIGMNGRKRSSPAQTPWVCGAEEEESCLCHRYTDLWRRTKRTKWVSTVTTQSRWEENLDLMLSLRLTCHVTSSLGWSLFFLSAVQGKTKDTVSHQTSQGGSITSFCNANFKEERSWHS